MSKKTIWIINQYASDPEYGIGGRSYYFAKSLADEGHQVVLISASCHHLMSELPSHRSNKSEKIAEGLYHYIVGVLKYKKAHSKVRILNWFLFSFKLAFSYKKISKIIGSPDVVVVSSPSIFSTIGASYVARKARAKFVFDIRDLWPLTLIELGNMSERNPLIWLMGLVERYTFKRADAVTSNWPMAHNYFSEKGFCVKKFSWLPNGFSLDEFSENQPLSDSLIKKIPKEKFLVGYAGTLGMANALDVMLDAASLLKDVDDIAFLIVGDGGYRAHLEKRVKEENLSNVIFLGRVNKKQVSTVLSIFNLCYVGFNKSPLYRYGNSLNKLPEYFASRKPIVFSIDSPFKPVDIANAGITVKAENPKEISDAILNIYSMSHEEREQLGDNGWRYALENYEYRVLVKNLESIFDNQ